tara:strand:+ start:2258 stop:3928 length:1671 start_codon:yes stop_codon:yes gene_type:complete
MRVLYIAFFLSILSGQFFEILAQTGKTSSLLNSLELTEEDTSLIDLYISISLSYQQTNPDSAEYYALKAIDLAKTNPSLIHKVEANLHLGRVYIRQGGYAKGLEVFFKVLEYLEQLPTEIKLKAETLRGIGNIYFIQYKYNEALSFYDEALDYFTILNDEYGKSMVYGNYANVYYETDRLALALSYYKRQLSIYKESGSEMDLGSTYLNMGMLYETMDSLDLAINFSKDALEIAERNNALVMMTYPLKVLSTVSRRLENFPQAIDYAQQSLDLATQLNIIYEKKDAHLNLADSYEKVGRYKDAYFHYKSHKELNDTLLNEDANTRLAEMSAKYESEKKEQEIFVLEAKNELQKTRIAAISSSLGLIVALFLIGVIWFVTKKRKEVELLEKDKLLAKSDEKIAREELANSKLREENLQNELTNYALHIIEKNDFLEGLKSEMAEIRTTVKSEEALRHINSLGSKIYRNMMLNKDREEFELQIDQVCDGFFKNLENKYPELTSQEKRLAALLRLNLSSKEISGIMNISPKSVDQGRYRLRKKLVIKKNRSLSTFLNQI